MIYSLNSLRFLFIMLVVMSHIIGKSFDFGGECGVAFFFILSGFVLSYAYGSRVEDGTFRLGAFLKKQLSKFYPLHLLTFFLMLGLDSILGRFYDWPKLLANAFLLQSWVPSDDFYFVANGLSWFLSDLLFFYIVFPLVFKWLNRSSLKALTIGGVMVLAFYVLLAVSIPTSLINPLLYASPITRLIDFCIGILVFRFWMSLRGKECQRFISGMSSASISVLEIMMFLMVVLSFYVYENSSLRFRCASLFWLVLPIVIYVFVATDKMSGVVIRGLHQPMMQWLGDISLEIYLIHLVTMRVFYSIMASLGMGEEQRLHPLVILMTIIIIILVSYLTKRSFVDPIFTRLTKIMK